MAADRSHDQGKREAAHLQRAKDDAPGADMQEAHPLLQLQRQVGNAQVARMLAQRQPSTIQRALPDDLMRAGNSLQLTGSALLGPVPQAAGGPAMNAGQALLSAGVNMKVDEAQKAAMAGVQRSVADVQREAEEDDEEIQRSVAGVQRESADEKDELQLKRDAPEVGLAGGPISDGLAGQIRAQRGGGSALDTGTRERMEGSFGASFEDVRVHTSTTSASLNRSLSAKAFTTGSDIFFGEGASPSDHSLLAHELTHVVQQRGMSASGPMTVGPAGDSHEQAAEAASAAVVNTPAPAQRHMDEDHVG